MLKQLPFKKQYLFIGCSLLILYLCYQLAFKATIEAWHVNRQLTQQLTQSADLSYQPAYLERKNANLNKLLNRYKTDTVAFRSNIISTIASIAEKQNVKLSEVPVQDPLYHTDQVLIQKLDFEGDFFSLTKVLKQLQQTAHIGMVRAVTYRTIKMDSGTSAVKKLVLEIYFEIIK